MTTRYRYGIQAATITGAGSGSGISPFAKVYYVKTTGSDGNTGLDPNAAFLTINAAISASTAGQGDTIIIAPGSYTETVMAPKAHTIFRAAVMNYLRPSVVISTSAASGVTVEADGVQFYGIEFKAAAAAVNHLVLVADTVAVDGLVFDSCVFHGADQTSVVGIGMVDATFAATRVSITNCTFRDLTGTMIDVGVKGMAYSYIGYNRFCHDINSGIGIALADTTAFVTGKAYVIEHNVFLPFDATGDEVGIAIAGTENTTGAGIIRNNYFSYGAAATSITQDKLSLSMVNNYTGDAATGGTLVDPGT